jgi:hypothetical protein
LNKILYQAMLKGVSNYKNIAAAAPSPAKIGAAVLIGPTAPTDPATPEAVGVAPDKIELPLAPGVTPNELPLAPCVALLNFSAPAVIIS